jgi:hypothetical protein
MKVLNIIISTTGNRFSAADTDFIRRDLMKKMLADVQLRIMGLENQQPTEEMEICIKMDYRS